MTVLAAGVVAARWGVRPLTDPLPWSAGEGLSLIFGIVAAGLAFGQVLYPLRRALMARPFGTAQAALSFHVWSSLALVVCVAAHVPGRMPAGWIGRWLLLLAGLTLGSGLLVLLAQRRLPRRHDSGAAASANAARARTERWLRACLVVHVPPAFAFLALVAWHIFGVMYF
jgi:hypothetical protein